MNSYWFGNTIPAGIDPHDDQIINGASSGMTRYKALYVEAAENMIDPNIYYDINEYGYRCPPFENIDSDLEINAIRLNTNQLDVLIISIDTVFVTNE